MAHLTALSSCDVLFQGLSDLIKNQQGLSGAEQVDQIDRECLYIHRQYQETFRQLHRTANSNALLKQNNMQLKEQIIRKEQETQERLQGWQEKVGELESRLECNSRILVEYEHKFEGRLAQQREHINEQYDQTSRLIDMQLEIEDKNRQLQEQQTTINELTVQLSDQDIAKAFRQLKDAQDRLEEQAQEIERMENRNRALVVGLQEKDRPVELDERQDLFPMFLFGMTYLWKKDNISLDNLEMMELSSDTLLQSIGSMDAQQKLITNMVQVQEQVEQHFLEFTKRVRTQLLADHRFRSYLDGLSTHLSTKELIQLIR